MRTRALLGTEFAPLSHMLMNGFFLSQGLDIALPLWQPCRGRFGCLDNSAPAVTSAAGSSGKRSWLKRRATSVGPRAFEMQEIKPAKGDLLQAGRHWGTTRASF